MTGRTIVARRAHKAVCASAGKGADIVGAGAAVEARVRGALVNLRAARHASEALRTHAGVAVDLVHALPPVGTGAAAALVDVWRRMEGVRSNRAQGWTACIKRLRSDASDGAHITACAACSSPPPPLPHITDNSLVWHTSPVKPGTHEQVNPLTWSTQVPPLVHGSEAHSFTSAEKLEKSGAQVSRGCER